MGLSIAFAPAHAYAVHVSSSSFAPLRCPACDHTTQTGAPPRRVHAAGVRATLSEDFLTGPSSPPRARPLWQVVTFSAATGLLWYGYYKWCIEEELKNEGPGGLGAPLALGPFGAGALSPLVLPPENAAVCFALGFAWIVGVQFSLYKRINTMYREKDMVEPLRTYWAFIFPLNLVVGLRSVHFLSEAYGGREDKLAERLPWVTKPELTFLELITTPKMWLKL